MHKWLLWHHFSITAPNHIYMKKTTTFILALTATVATMVACSKDDAPANGTTNLRVNLTDAPLDELDSIYVDIREVRVKMGNDTSSTDDNGWQTLTANAGIYDLLSYQNNVDTLLASGPVPTGYVKEIRLILGNNNSVVDTFGVRHSLTIPSGSESGLKIKVNRRLNTTLDSLLVDFDAALSVKNEGASGYKLRPVIKIKN
ncbi:MAG: DUF4382 domain-containing protein [Moraxellaceae bacterium]|nr:MAG: DUF4382 domain-containing protein [Moraxellaceae bacterium]